MPFPHWQPDGDYDTVEKCRRALEEQYYRVTRCVDNQRAAADPSTLRPDFAIAWSSKEEQEKHLPATLQLLRLNYLEKRLPSTPLDYGYPDQRAQGPRTLLLMAGYSSEQIALSIAFHFICSLGHADGEEDLPVFVPFVGTLQNDRKDESTPWPDVFPEVKAALKRMLGSQQHGENFAEHAIRRIHNCISVASSDPADVFHKIAVEWWNGETEEISNKERRIAVDVTGGKKPMDSGGAYAAMYLGVPAYYLDFELFDPPARRPFPHSLHYEQLALPGTIFSHDSRKAILTNFQSRRFQIAHSLANRLLTSTKENKSLEKFFGPDEIQRIESAERNLKKCDAWMTADYENPILSDDPVAMRFINCQQPADGSPKKGPHEIVADIQSQFFARRDEPANEDEFMLLILNEYWRLRTMLGENFQTEDASLSDVAEQIRDVIVGSCGLAECIVDTIFLSPRIKVIMDKCFGARPEFGNKELTDQLQKEREEIRAKFDKHQRKLCELIPNCIQEIPGSEMPHSIQNKKSRLLRGQRPDVTLYLALKSVKRELDNSDDALCSVIASALNRQLTDADPRVEVNCKLRLQLDDSEDLSEVIKAEEDWKSNWGNFGVSGSKWVEARNQIAHMRLPATREHLEIAKSALTDYLPRFIGLLSLIVRPDSEFPVNRDKVFTDGTSLTETPRGPWHGIADELRDLLRLPPSDQQSE